MLKLGVLGKHTSTHRITWEAVTNAWQTWMSMSTLHTFSFTNEPSLNLLCDPNKGITLIALNDLILHLII